MLSCVAVKGYLYTILQYQTLTIAGHGSKDTMLDTKTQGPDSI